MTSQIAPLERSPGVAAATFDELVVTHGPMVLRVCRALLAPADADDAWAETFVAAMRAFPDLRPDSNVAGWLATIAHRKAIDQLRQARRRPRPVAEVPEAPAADDPARPGDDELRRALRALPPRQRQVVLYRYLADLAYPQIAALVGSTEAAVRRNAADGIANLRRIYPRGVDP